MAVQDRWNHRSVKAPQALDKLPKKANGDINWGSIRVAHLDTGYTRHDAFGAWTAGGSNGIIETPGKDFFQPSRPSAQDPLTPVTAPQEVGHGTRTSAVLAGRSASGDFLGVAPGLPVVPYRINNDSLILEKSAFAIGAAITDIVNQGRCQVISISQGFPFVLDKAMGRAVDKAYLAGLIICCAAGQFIDRVCYPAKHRRAIGVGGYRKSGRQYQKYDRYGRIDSWAPADNITRPNVADLTSYSTNGDGTSYSTVHVSAAAAMWLRYHGAAIGQTYGNGAADLWRRVEAFRLALRASQRILPFKTSSTTHPGNSAGKLDISNLLSVPLPPKNSLLREDDLAGDDEM
ncbi:MAG TPA: S8/S53 family peptidase [Dongiaceae bacterium]